jgi:hypothetical protein
MTSLHRPTTPLRQRMIEDMKLRDLSPNAILAYVDRVAAFAKHFGKSPQLLGPKEVRGGFAGLSLGFGFPADWRATKASRPRRRGAEQAASRGQAGGFAGSSLVFGFPGGFAGSSLVFGFSCGLTVSGGSESALRARAPR